mmetsp:Transcript_24239/g.64906  ORF Transcript_24239/g.64906 Transcript_24239/m.64906 type:complete len:137 (+) Transcript_24239:95-505(+)
MSGTRFTETETKAVGRRTGAMVRKKADPKDAWLQFGSGQTARETILKADSSSRNCKLVCAGDADDEAEDVLDSRTVFKRSRSLAFSCSNKAQASLLLRTCSRKSSTSRILRNRDAAALRLFDSILRRVLGSAESKS